MLAVGSFFRELGTGAYSESDAWAISPTGLVDPPQVSDTEPYIARTLVSADAGTAKGVAAATAEVIAPLEGYIGLPSSTSAASYLGTATDGQAFIHNYAEGIGTFTYDDSDGEPDGFYGGIYVAGFGGGQAFGQAGWGASQLAEARIFLDDTETPIAFVQVSGGSGLGNPGTMTWNTSVTLNLPGQDTVTFTGTGGNIYVSFVIPLDDGDELIFQTDVGETSGSPNLNAAAGSSASINLHQTTLSYGFAIEGTVPAPPLTTGIQEVFGDNGPGDMDGDGDTDQSDLVAWEQAWAADVVAPWVSGERGAPLIVTTEEDVDDGDYSFHDLSLREALTLADDANHPDADIIVFADWVEHIDLNSELVVDSDVEIIGPGANDLTIDGNGNGRVFYVSDGTGTVLDVTINGLTVTGGNASGSGGGIYSNSENLSLGAVDVTNNTASYSGGGIYATGGASSASLSIKRSSISANTGSQVGGLLIADGGVLELIDSTIAYNTGNAMGGMYVLNSDADIVNSTISSNTGGYSGGGVHIYAPSNVINIVNSTIAFNESFYYNPSGVRVDAANEVVVSNSIIADNLVNGTPQDVSGTFSTASSHNLIGAIDGSTGLTDATSYTGTAMYPQASGLGALNNYGGPTQTHPLLIGSNAIDNGSDTIALTTFGLIADQRGKDRKISSAVDIGAYESGNPLTLQVGNTSDVADGVYDDDNMSLREAISLVPNFAGDATITFADHLFDVSPQTIYTSSALGHFTIAEDFDIAGPGANLLAIDGAHNNRVFNVTSAGEATISGLTVQNGSGVSYGGGISNDGTLTFDSVEIISNNATSGGGGIENTGTLTIQNSTIAENLTNATGGGLLQSAGSATLINTTISSNDAYYGGAGIHATGGSIHINHSTITQNDSYHMNGAGILREGSYTTVTLYHTIVADNHASNGAVESDISGSIVSSSSWNLIGTGGSGGLSHNVNNNKVGIADPGLLALDYYGDESVLIRTHALLLTSEAIDSGDPSIVGEPETDARGYLRINNEADGIDIGAFERVYYELGT